MKVARELVEKRLKMKDILLAHDVAEFRKFVEKNKNIVANLKVVKQIKNYSDSMLSEFMHAMKASQPYLGEKFQESRNFFRVKSLEAGLKQSTLGGENSEVSAYMHEHEGKYPQCYQCKYFREPPPGEKVGCIHLMPSEEQPNVKPALPLDVACVGFMPLGSTKN